MLTDPALAVPAAESTMGITPPAPVVDRPRVDPLGVDAGPSVLGWAVVRITRRVLSVLVPSVAVFLVWRRLSSSGAALSALGRVHPVGLAAVIGLALSGYVLSAIGLGAAAARPLPLGRTVGAQLAAAFANRVTVGGTGGLVTNMRYLERTGSTRTEAMSALSLQWVIRLAVHLVAIVALGSLAHSKLRSRWSLPDPLTRGSWSARRSRRSP
jgi:hypothetical protein